MEENEKTGPKWAPTGCLPGLGCVGRVPAPDDAIKAPGKTQCPETTSSPGGQPRYRHTPGDKTGI